MKLLITEAIIRDDLLPGPALIAILPRDFGRARERNLCTSALSVPAMSGL